MAGFHRQQPRIPFGVVLAVLVALVVGSAVWRSSAGGTRIAGVSSHSPGPSPPGDASHSPSRSPSPSPSPGERKERKARDEPSASPKPKHAPTGKLLVVPGRGPVSSPKGTLKRYIVEVEEGLPIDGKAFALHVERVLANPKGWGGTGGVAFQRVDSGAVSFRVTLASRDTTDDLCYPLVTNGIYSCFMRGRAVLNVWRWRTGSDVYPNDIQAYRIYMINHEVGHAIGHGHTTCPGVGQKAPVMMQQSKGLYGCVANPWPLSWERGSP